MKYTVFGVYEDNRQRYAATVEADTPLGAEATARALASAGLIIAGVVEGQVVPVDEDPETRVDSAEINPGLWVNVYSVTRHLGGHEEGGWWYNRGKPLASTHVDNEEEARTIRETCKGSFTELEWGNIYSVNGGVQIDVLIEDHPAKEWPLETPHYE